MTRGLGLRANRLAGRHLALKKRKRSEQLVECDE